MAARTATVMDMVYAAYLETQKDYPGYPVEVHANPEWLRKVGYSMFRIEDGDPDEWDVLTRVLVVPDESLGFACVTVHPIRVTTGDLL